VGVGGGVGLFGGVCGGGVWGLFWFGGLGVVGLGWGVCGGGFGGLGVFFVCGWVRGGGVRMPCGSNFYESLTPLHVRMYPFLAPLMRPCPLLPVEFPRDLV